MFTLPSRLNLNNQPHQGYDFNQNIGWAIRHCLNMFKPWLDDCLTIWTNGSNIICPTLHWIRDHIRDFRDPRHPKTCARARRVAAVLSPVSTCPSLANVAESYGGKWWFLAHSANRHLEAQKLNVSALDCGTQFLHHLLEVSPCMGLHGMCSRCPFAVVGKVWSIVQNDGLMSNGK